MVQKRNFWFNISALVVILTLSVFPFAQTASAAIPVTAGNSDSQSGTQNSSILSMSDFTTAVQDGEDIIRGVYVDDVMALRVVQQPSGKAGFVSSIVGIATQFKMAEQYGTVGLLAHNFASGSLFPDVKEDAVINIIYGNGKVNNYKVTSIVMFQALSPNSATSSFVDLGSGEKLSAGKLFEKIYKGTPHLVLQTCIAKDNEASWGRLFIIAEPVVEETM